MSPKHAMTYGEMYERLFKQLGTQQHRSMLADLERALVSERDDLRAQLEAVTRERDEFRTQALELVTERNNEQADKLAAAAQRDEARTREATSEALYVSATDDLRAAQGEIDEARADAARLREALKNVRRRIEVMGDGEASDSVRVHNRLLNQSEDALKVIHAALKKGGRK